MTNKSTNVTSPPAEDRAGAASILSDLKGAPGESPQAMPDLAAAAGSRKSKLKVHSQTLVIALVLAASGAALYTMRKQGMGAGVNFSPPKIEYTVDLNQRKASDAQQMRVLTELEKSKSPVQVPVEKIQKNPFQLDSGTTTAHGATLDPNAASANREKLAAQARQQQITSALTTIEVGAIMAGNIPLARINGRIVREGEMVADVFMVKEIHDRSVDLEADGKVYRVNMAEGTTGGPRPRPPMPPRR